MVTRKENKEAVEEFFGDSCCELSEADFLTFSLGLAAGLALGMMLLGPALAITVFADSVLLYVGDRFFRIPMSVLYGILAGTHTQPVVLGFAGEQTRNDLPGVGYATVYPVATVLKIVLAQVLLGVAG